MELAELLAHWDIGPVSGVEAVLQGSVNRVFRVQVGQQTLYLRLYRSSDMTVLEREALVMAAARLDGIPVPTTLPTRSGAGWINMDGQVCALFQAVTGFQVVRSDLTVEQARAVGACLARLHRALEPLPDLGWWRYNVAYDLRATAKSKLTLHLISHQSAGQPQSRAGRLRGCIPLMTSKRTFLA